MTLKSICRGICFISCMLFANLIFSQNLLDTSTWTIGQGSVSGFSINGSSSENIRENGHNHVGESVILWKAVPDASNNADGGWNSSYHNIDNTKSYRFSVWIKKTNSNDGTTYFGCQTYSSQPELSNMVLTISGNYQNNPYFWNGDLPQLNKWYLLVGFLHHKNYNGNNFNGAIYDGETGSLVQNIYDYKFSSTTTEIRHRAYLYYDTNVNDRQYFYEPRIDEVNSSMPTINELLSINPDSKLLFVYDNAGNQKQRFYCSDSSCIIPDPPAGRSPIQDENIKSNEVSNNPQENSYTIRISPNPVEDLFTVNLSGKEFYLANQINIYSLNGSLVKVSKINERFSVSKTINISQMPSGVYLVHIHLNNGEFINQKIIKE